MKTTRCLALLSSFALLASGLVACGSAETSSKETKVDYSTWSYNDFVTAEKGTENYWNSKTISYQFAEREENNISVYAGVYYGMANLYSDGSVALWEPSGLVTMGYFDGIERYDTKYAILEMFYGSWKEESGTITVSFYTGIGEDTDLHTYKTTDSSAIQMELFYSGGTCGIFDFDNTNGSYKTWESYCETHTEMHTDLEG